jgi:hypothetical protein
MKKFYSLLTSLVLVSVGIQAQQQSAIQKFPLYEMFTSSTCGPCRPGNVQFNTQMANYKDEAVILKYQQDFPGTGDPYATTETVSRRSYYGINSIPTLEIDGGWHKNPAGSTPFTSSLHLDAKNQSTIVNIEAYYELDPANQTIAYSYKIWPETDIPDVLRIMVAIYETITVQNVKSNGETEFENVVKKMQPGHNGKLLISGLKADLAEELEESYVFQGSYKLPINGQSANRTNHSIEHSVENFENLRMAVWVQDATTKEVLQAAVAKIKGEENVSISSKIAKENSFVVFPNPANEKLTIQFDYSKSQQVQVSITDMLGKSIYLQNHSVSQGISDLFINTSDFPKAMYLLQVQEGDKISTTKFSIAK